MDLKWYAFLSYQTADKSVAGAVKRALHDVGIASFLAHEDISVSEEWARKILEEIQRADLFICILSTSYLTSQWCLQESGIAAARADMTTIPLSLDGTTPPGFLARIQAVRIRQDSISLADLVPGFVKHDPSKGIDVIIDLIGRSTSYRTAEANFLLLRPHAQALSDDQARELLERVAANNQVHHATLCAREYLPPLLARYGRVVPSKTLQFLSTVCAQYSA